MADGDNAADLVISNRDYADSQPAAQTTRWADTNTASGLRAGGESLAKSGQAMMASARADAAANANRPSSIPGYRKGGTVRKTGLAKVHRGELVIPKNKARKVKKLLKRKSGRG